MTQADHQTLAIQVEEWPTRGDLQEFHRSSLTSKEEARVFLMQEFDSVVSFRIGDTDLLAGYKEAFILPVHSFLGSISRGLKILFAEGTADVHVCLQQFEIGPEDKAHHMTWKRVGPSIHLEFYWGGESIPPTFLKEPLSFVLSPAQMQREISRVLESYYNKMARLLGHSSDWSGDEIAELFQDF